MVAVFNESLTLHELTGVMSDWSLNTTSCLLPLGWSPLKLLEKLLIPTKSSRYFMKSVKMNYCEKGVLGGC